MPLSGGIAAPIVTPMKSKSHGKSFNQISTSTYIELDSETPNIAVYFTTDGSKPDPIRRKIGGKEITFRYNGPFTLKPGKRTVRAVAVHKVTKVESHVVTKTFFVDDKAEDNNDDEAELSDDMSSVYSDRSDLKKSITPRMSKSASVKDAWSEDSVDRFLQRTADQGFTATNVSGTQINLWGGNPGMGWDIRTPGNIGFKGGYQPQVQYPPQTTQPNPSLLQHQQLNDIANHLTQRIDQNRQATVSDVRQALKDLENSRPKELPAPAAPPKGSFEPEILPVSGGDGDLKKQIQHIYGHLLQFARSNPEFSAAVGSAKMGKVVTAEFDEGDQTFLVTLQLGKPGFKKPLAEPKNLNTNEINKKSLRPKPEEVPKGHTVEEKVRQAKGEKAAAIELKTEEKPPELVQSSYFETEEYVQNGTLSPSPDFDSNKDCEKLRNAMKGLGTDEAAIISVMGFRAFKQRMEIVEKFKSLYGRDLIKDFESELSANFLKICKALCLSPDEYDASELRAAMKGLGTDEDCLIEIVCTRTNEQIRAFKNTYKQLYPGRDLEKDIDSETSSHFKRLLISLLQATRDESKTFDRNLAIKDAQELFDAGEKKWGTDESKFHQILFNRANPHLRAVFEEYEKLSKMTMEQAISSEMSGDLKTSLITFVRCIQNKPRYFALALHKSMKGLGTNDQTLLRIIITRCEIDMVQIKAAFQAEFSARLGEWIRDDTSGDYRKILLSLIGDTDLIK